MTRGRGHSLPVEDINRIERMFRAGKTQTEVVKLTGVSKSTVCQHFKRLREFECKKQDLKA